MQITVLGIDPRSQQPGEPTLFTVGKPVVENGYAVEDIKFYNPAIKPFNKGTEVVGPVYVVYFEGIPQRRVFPAFVVSSLEMVATKATEKQIELPD